MGRRREIAEVERLLSGAQSGAGGVLLVLGPAGAGKTTLLSKAAASARSRGLEVHLGPDPLDVDWARVLLASPGPGLVLVDDVDQGGAESLDALSILAAGAGSAALAVVSTSGSPLGIGEELRLAPLGEDDLAVALGVVDADLRHALWLASGGWPGPAQQLAANLAGLDDPMVQLALDAPSRTWFLGVDVNLVRLIEVAIQRTSDDATRARLLGRLARELLGDASAAERRRVLATQAVALARAVADPKVLAEALDARLGAVWDPAGAEERLATGAEIVELSRLAGDLERERKGLFWRFVALMELGRVTEAESTLAHFERQAELAADAEGALMAKARRASLAALRGRFDEASRMADAVRDEGRRIRLPDADSIAASVHAMVTMMRGSRADMRAGVSRLLRVAQQDPGHFHEASAAHVLAFMDEHVEASLELERVLPRVLAGSGPRWVGAMAHLAYVAAATGDLEAAQQIYERLLPFRGRMVTFGGAAMTMEAVSHYLGLLALALGATDDAVAFLAEAVALEEGMGALALVARSLDEYARALDARGGPGDTQSAAAAGRRARSIAERLGMSALLERIAPRSNEWRLTRDGDDWVLSAGSEQIRLRDSRGMRYLRGLLASPGRDVPALELAGGGDSLISSDTGPVLDDIARQAYRSRLSELDAERDRADRAGDPALANAAEAEREAILAELRRATGLGGRPRLTSPDAERARVNVTRTLRATLDQIGERAPKAAAHLQASIRTGRTCRYQPAPGGPSRWSV